MLRIIIETIDYGTAANLGGPVNIIHKTFDVDLPEVEKYLRLQNDRWSHGRVTGIEIVEAP